MHFKPISAGGGGVLNRGVGLMERCERWGFSTLSSNGG